VSDAKISHFGDEQGLKKSFGTPASETMTNVENPAEEQEIATSSDGRAQAPLEPEIGGRSGPEPTRYGDWEKGGRCIDF